MTTLAETQAAQRHTDAIELLSEDILPLLDLFMEKVDWNHLSTAARREHILDVANKTAALLKAEGLDVD